MLITELNSALKNAILEKNEAGFLKKDEEKILDILNQFNENNATPNIDFNGHPIIYPAVSHFSDNILLKLLELGVDANCIISVGELKATPLHVAIYHKSIKKVQHLLNFNANINAQDSNGDTALHLSLNFHELKLAKILLEQGIDQTIRNKTDKIASDLNTTNKAQELFKEVEDNRIAKGQTFSLSLKCSDDSVSNDDLKMLLEGNIENFIEESKLDYVNRTTVADEGVFKLKFIGNSSYADILKLSTKYNNILASQANDIYGTTNIKLSFQDNADLIEKANELEIELGGNIPLLTFDD